MTHYEHAQQILAWSETGNNQQRTQRVADALAEKDVEIDDLKFDNQRLHDEMSAEYKVAYLEAGMELARDFEADNKVLQAEIERLKIDRHDPNCDTRDLMISGKPCNCYLTLSANISKLTSQLNANCLQRDALQLNNQDAYRDRVSLISELEDLRAEIERLNELLESSRKRGWSGAFVERGEGK